MIKLDVCGTITETPDLHISFHTYPNNFKLKLSNFYIKKLNFINKIHILMIIFWVYRKMYPSLMPTAVKDNYDDDDNLSDIDDEVFIRDGKSGVLKIDDDFADKRPLMAPRRKEKNMHNMDRHTMPYKVLFAPFCYGTLALVILIALILLGIFTINIIFPMPLNLIRNWFFRKNVVLPVMNNNNETVACTSLTYDVIWTRTLPKFAAEAPLRKSDVNGDDKDDIIIGFSIGNNFVLISISLCF